MPSMKKHRPQAPTQPAAALPLSRLTSAAGGASAEQETLSFSVHTITVQKLCADARLGVEFCRGSLVVDGFWDP